MKKLYACIIIFCCLLLQVSCGDNNQAKKGKYQINYYIEQEGEFTLYKQEEKLAVIGELTIVPQSIKGYEFAKENENNVLTNEITLTDTAIFKIYYNLKKLNVSYMLDEVQEYKKVELSAFSVLKESRPVNPIKEGYVFDCWRYLNGNKVDFNSKITNDLFIYAGWNNSTEVVDYTKFEGQYYGFIDNDEFILSIGSDKKATLLKNGGVISETVVTISTDSYANFGTDIFGKTSSKTKAFFSGMSLNIVGNNDICFSKNGHLIYDFNDNESLENVQGKIYKSWFNSKSISTATVSLIDRYGEMPTTYETTNYDGVLKAELAKKESNADYYGGGCTILFSELPKEKTGKSLKIRLGILVEDRLDAENEVIILYTLDKNGNSDRSDLYKWYTIGNSASEWLILEISADKMFGGESECVSGLCVKSYRDDNFYIDYICYIYE